MLCIHCATLCSGASMRGCHEARPDHGVVHTGLRRGSGIVVIDVDLKHDGYATPGAARAGAGALSQRTPRARTGSGGLHIARRISIRAHSKARLIAPGIVER